MSDSDDENFETATKFPRYHLQRKQRRKTRTTQSLEEGEEPPIIQGLWVQEIDWLKSADRETTSSAEIIPPPPQFTDSASDPCRDSCMCDSCSCADVCDCVRRSEEASPSEDQCRSVDTEDTSSTDHRGGSGSDTDSVRTHESDSDSSYDVDVGTQGIMSTFDLMYVSGFTPSSNAGWNSDSRGSVQNPLGNSEYSHSLSTENTSQCSFGFDDMSDAVLDELRGKVAHIPKLLVSAFCRDFIKRILNSWKTSKPANEGLIFHDVRHPHPVHPHCFCSWTVDGRSSSIQVLNVPITVAASVQHLVQLLRRCTSGYLVAFHKDSNLSKNFTLTNNNE